MIEQSFEPSGCFRNKCDENGNVVRNNGRLLGKDYNQEEAIDYE